MPRIKFRTIEYLCIMSRDEIIKKIVEYLSDYDPKKIGVFGSFARGEDSETSDLDLLVSFNKTFGLLDLVKIERELSEILDRKVDLLTEGALKNEKLKKYILKDMQIIY